MNDGLEEGTLDVEGVSLGASVFADWTGCGEGAVVLELSQSSVGAAVVAMPGSPPSVGWLLGVEDGTAVSLPQFSSVGTAVVAWSFT